MIYIPIQGTDSWRDNEWWTKGSPFTTFLETLGWHVFDSADPFVWSTDVDGTKFWGNDPHRDWAAGGAALTYYLKDVPFAERNLIAHSHGLQVALYAAARIPIRSLLSIAGPIRKDMDDIRAKAKPNIQRWVHVVDKKWDRIAFLGQLFDGRWFGSRTDKFADVNLQLEKISHSNLLRDPAFFHFWPEVIFPAEAHT